MDRAARAHPHQRRRAQRGRARRSCARRRARIRSRASTSSARARAPTGSTRSRRAADIYRLDVEGPPGAKLVPMWAGGGYTRGRRRDHRRARVGCWGHRLRARARRRAAWHRARGWSDDRGRAGVSPDARCSTRLAVRAHRQARRVFGAARSRRVLGVGAATGSRPSHRPLARPSARGLPGDAGRPQRRRDAQHDTAQRAADPRTRAQRVGRAGARRLRLRRHRVHDRAHLPAERFRRLIRGDDASKHVHHQRRSARRQRLHRRIPGSQAQLGRGR